jgi:hypothetical protein
VAVEEQGAAGEQQRTVTTRVGAAGVVAPASASIAAAFAWWLPALVLFELVWAETVQLAKIVDRVGEDAV